MERVCLCGRSSWKTRWALAMAQMESQRRVARGGTFVQTAEAAGRRGLQDAAMGGFDLLHVFGRDKHLILQHATAHANMIAEARRQVGRASHETRPTHGGTGQGTGRINLARPAQHAAQSHYPTQGFDSG